jgi:hypothetical protein
MSHVASGVLMLVNAGWFKKCRSQRSAAAGTGHMEMRMLLRQSRSFLEFYFLPWKDAARTLKSHALRARGGSLQ